MSATDVKKSPGRVKAADKAVVADALEDVDVSKGTVTDYAKRLQGLTVPELRILRADALVEESESKRFLVLLRQRAANMASTVGPEVEEEIVRAKQEQVKAEAWLKAVEARLENEFVDIYGTKK